MSKQEEERVKQGSYYSPVARFRDWMHSRGGIYAEMKMLRYMDGEPYFAYLGAEISLSEFLEREDELNILKKDI